MHVSRDDEATPRDANRWQKTSKLILAAFENLVKNNTQDLKT
jgi:hypothetical protein